MEDTIRDMMMVRAMSNSQRHDSGGSELIDDEANGVSLYSDFLFSECGEILHSLQCLQLSTVVPKAS